MDTGRRWVDSQIDVKCVAAHEALLNTFSVTNYVLDTSIKQVVDSLFVCHGSRLLPLPIEVWQYVRVLMGALFRRRPSGLLALHRGCP